MMHVRVRAIPPSVGLNWVGVTNTLLYRGCVMKTRFLMEGRGFMPDEVEVENGKSLNVVVGGRGPRCKWVRISWAPEDRW